MFSDQKSLLIKEVHIRVQANHNAELSCFLIKCNTKRTTCLAQGHTLLLHWDFNKKKTNTYYCIAARSDDLYPWKIINKKCFTTQCNFYLEMVSSQFYIDHLIIINTELLEKSNNDSKTFQVSINQKMLNINLILEKCIDYELYINGQLPCQFKCLEIQISFLRRL